MIKMQNVTLCVRNSPFQACGRKCCKSFTHDGFLKVQSPSWFKDVSSSLSRLSEDQTAGCLCLHPLRGIL